MPKHPSPVHRPSSRAPEAVGGATACGSLPEAQPRDEPHRLGRDPPRHLALAELAVAKDDRHLGDVETGTDGAIRKLDLERVPLRAHAVEVDRLEHLAAEALEAARQVADLQAEHDARVHRAALADQAA